MQRVQTADLLETPQAWSAIVLAGRDPVSGTAYLLSLGVFALMPWWLALREVPGRQ
jgi:hypothetical protein